MTYIYSLPGDLRGAKSMLEFQIASFVPMSISVLKHGVSTYRALDMGINLPPTMIVTATIWKFELCTLN
jgi:hypothetical protein